MRKYLQLLSIVVLLLSSSQVMAQKVRVVTGHVYDPGKEALVGVTVAVKGSTSGGAITDENGRYMILVPNENGTVIVFSSIVVIPFSSEVSSFRVITSLIIVGTGFIFRSFS